MNAQARALAAAVTPLTGAGEQVDVPAIASLVGFYAAAGLDGLLVLGTTGEGILLSVAERRATAAEFLRCSPGRIPIIVHCGAQSTRDTATLAEHAAGLGAAGVAVIAPPYFAPDERALQQHFVVAASACAPAPFYIYEFAARSGYAVPLSVVARLRDLAPNFTGLKVSDTPFDRVQPYLVSGLDVFIGAEELIHRGLVGGARGAVSGLAAALPELTVRAVRSGSAEHSAAAGRVRASLQRFPFHAAVKHILRWRGVPIETTVRAPLRGLDVGELDELERLLADPDGEIAHSVTASTVSGAPPKRSSRSAVRSNVLQR
ncbi:MAG: dihydrodipicolinate synthase family protein [Candidatus Dormibacteria bacterium]